MDLDLQLGWGFFCMLSRGFRRLLSPVDISRVFGSILFLSNRFLWSWLWERFNDLLLYFYASFDSKVPSKWSPVVFASPKSFWLLIDLMTRPIWCWSDLMHQRFNGTGDLMGPSIWFFSNLVVDDSIIPSDLMPTDLLQSDLLSRAIWSHGRFIDSDRFDFLSDLICGRFDPWAIW